MSFPRYPSYRDSGVEWLGEVPEHWEVGPFKHQIARNDGGVWGDDPDGIDDTIVLRSTEQTVDGHWQLNDPAPRKLSKSDIESSLLIEGDLLLTKSSGSSLHIGKTTLVTSEIDAMRCCYSNFMQRIRMNPSFYPKLAWHVLNNNLARRQFDILSNSTTGLANLNGTMIGQIVVPVPTPAEQTLIASFLDRETAKIDALVAEQQRLIELLKEKRQAVISHAVTKGLNPDAPMKDSGVEWLGEVPEHWEVKKLAYLLSEPSKNGVSPEINNNGSTPTFSIAAVRNGIVDIENHIKFADIPRESAQPYLVKQNDILVLRGNGSKDLVGTAGIVACIPPENCIYPDILIRLRLNTLIQNSFFVTCLNSYTMRHQVENAAQTASGVWKISGTSLQALRMPLPPQEEQVEIQHHLEKIIFKINNLTAEAQRAIELLQERRAALISAAVTGQIDVRGLATGSPA
ncbi:restriction endonuclease subunit S [Holophaga foetida]|uniref:restriction endonuclease subunit S n=1 Tax=Holophaga foetida TaxID=35839 RepID=UPI0002472F11|nr:restriction endonuclease subunit S [Holophaga foetida]